ncbi:MAG: DUF6541 family protein [Arcanobacterium sp.]|nr:DUF6541 family protein [Arcanobacterium sp.]
MQLTDFFITWGGLLPSTLCALLVIFVPGLLFSKALNIPNIYLLLIAPAFTVAALIIVGLAYDFLNINWNIYTVCAAIFTLTIALWSTRVIFTKIFQKPVTSSRNLKNISIETNPRKLDPFTAHFDWPLTIIFILTFALYVSIYITATGSTEAFSQTWDNAYHLNITQTILETQNASTLNMNIYDVNAPQYYPGAWHTLLSLVSISAPLHVATTGLTIAISFVYWPLAIYSLSRKIIDSRIAQLLSIPLSCIFPQFPFGFFYWGTLYPNLLAISFLPAAFYFLIEFLFASTTRQRISSLGFLALVGIAITFSQPNTSILFILIALVMSWVKLFFRFFGFLKTALKTLTYSSLIAASVSALTTVLGLGISVFILNSVIDLSKTMYAMRTGFMFWPAQGTFLQGIAQIGTLTIGNPYDVNNLYTFSETAPIALLAFSGMLILLLKNFTLGTTLISAFGTISFLALLCFALGNPETRVYWVGLWYSDLPRLVAPMAIFIPVFTAISLQEIHHFLEDKLAYLTDKQRVPSFIKNTNKYATVLTTALIFALTGSLSSVKLQIQREFAITENSPVSKDELNLFKWISENIPKDAVIAGNPWEGAAFVWNISGIHSAYPQLVSRFEDPQREIIANELQNPAHHKEVCSAINDLGITHILDLDDSYIWEDKDLYGMELKYPGFDNLAGTGVGNTIKQIGKAKLIEITMCSP